MSDETTGLVDGDRPGLEQCGLSVKFVNHERILILLTLLALGGAVFFFSKTPTHDLQNDLIAVDPVHPVIVDLADGQDEWCTYVQVNLKAQHKRVGQGHTTITVRLIASKSNKTETWILAANSEMEGQVLWEVPRESAFPPYVTVSTDQPVPVAMVLEVLPLTAVVGGQVWFAAAILIGVYGLITFEIVHRAIAALFGSFVSLAALSVFHYRPTFAEVVSWIDFESLGLLFGMMIMVGIFSTTGFFEWCAIKLYRLSKGNLWRLVVFLCFFIACLPIPNVTSVLLLGPATIELCKVLEVNPINIIIAQVIFSNIGGCALLIGAVPNIIIANNAGIVASGKVSFLSFALHMLPGVLLSFVPAFFFVRRMYNSGVIKRDPSHPKRTEIIIWERELVKYNRRLPWKRDAGETGVRTKLETMVAQLKAELAEEEATGNVRHVDISVLERKYTITNRPLFISSCFVLATTIGWFFFYSALHVDLSLAWIAIIGCIVHLLVYGAREIDEILEKIDFGTLLFFAALFVLMECLQRMGLMDAIGNLTVQLIETVEPGSGRLALAITLIVWVSGGVSAFIDNIPFTTAMIPIIIKMSADSNLPLAPLIWALSFGTSFGGNGTQIGSSANVVAVGVAEQAGYNISFNYWLQTAGPVTLATLATANIYLLVTHVLLPWY